MCAVLVARGKRFPAIAIYTASKLGLRPLEIVNAEKLDLSCPLPGAKGNLGLHTLTIAPRDGETPSKTQTFDDSIVIDDPPWLGRLLENLSKVGGPKGPLFRVSPAELQEAWKETTLTMKVKAHPYQLRHTAASHDMLEKFRTPNQIRDRLRHKTSRSTQRYTKGGALLRAWHRLPENMRNWCQIQEQDIQQILEGSKKCGHPPVSEKVVSLVH
jgi:integrase